MHMCIIYFNLKVKIIKKKKEEEKEISKNYLYIAN